MDSRPQVIVSNDDGIEAEGLAALVGLLESIADVFVVAPDSPRSGVGHALSDDGPIPVRRLAEGRVAVGGTPADCARLALAAGSTLVPGLGEARRGRKAWLVSGINHGANLGVDTYVSGTAAAAREAAILGFPALAISQYVRRHRTPDWSRVAARSHQVLSRLLSQPPAAGAFWNVNLPHPPDDSVRCEIVHCPVDPSPHAVRYERRGEHYAYAGDYHSRPRLAGHDIDVCFGGRIAVSQIGLHGRLL